MKAKAKIEKARKAAVDFNASIGRARKEKFGRIAGARNRSMTGQLCQWIDETPDPAEAGSEKREVSSEM